MTLPLRDESSFCRPLYKVFARPLRSKSAYPPSIHFSPEGTTHSSDRLPHSTVSHTGKAPWSPWFLDPVASCDCWLSLH
ncbi:hypothetical protein CDEST_06391 [Colletotrichum destructivum]|uniref:Uncharacterized protein n=1 Tax=Colletotrichum destructivum TaxID=34406 RepID=A0AAX4IDQ5_9PEZI|nr:hypothetical protein CDEST_06391 [Colletotrichum destructivum]